MADIDTVFDWRKHLPVHPAAELFPLMSESDPVGFKAFVEDINVNGLNNSIVLFCENGENKVLDGRNRLDALVHLGRLCYKGGKIALRDRRDGDNWHTFTFQNARSADVTVGCDPYAFVLSANVHRRHLTAEQKRDLIAKVLKAKPEASNLSVAKQVKADDKTVASVRRELEANSEIPNKNNREEVGGRKARGRRPKQSTEIAQQKEETDEVERAEAPATGNDVNDDGDEPAPKGTITALQVLFDLFDLGRKWVSQGVNFDAIVTEMRDAYGEDSEYGKCLLLVINFIITEAVEEEEDESPLSGPSGGGKPEPAESPDDGSIPSFLLRTEATPQGAPQPVPLTPTKPAPTTPTPSPSPSGPRLTERTKIATHYLPAHRDPWPKGWHKLDAGALEEAIRDVQRFGINHRLEKRHEDQLTRMRSRLAELRRAERRSPQVNAGAPL